MPTRTEQEIMKNWKYDGPPLVSVVCITYNHEPYIRDAIEGFIMQETDFPFEIIIHDDASTDRTAEIIREYEGLFPHLIKPIYQKENQHSKGIKTLPIAWGAANGEDVAFCEGDDYWIDHNKLQGQISMMKKHPSCHISFHSAILKNKTKNVSDKIICKHRKKNYIFSTNQIIKNEGGFCPTASLVCRKEVLLKIPYCLFKKSPVGDYIIQIYGSLNGGALFLEQTSSVYNFSVPGSWSSNMANNRYYKSFIQESLETLDFLDINLCKKYHKEISFVKIKRSFKASIKLFVQKDFISSFYFLYKCSFFIFKFPFLTS